MESLVFKFLFYIRCRHKILSIIYVAKNWQLKDRRFSIWTVLVFKKVNHSFEPNAIFSTLDHPRFGVVASVISLRPIKAGEEIFTNYGYEPDVISSKYGFGWFTDLQESMPIKEEL